MGTRSALLLACLCIPSLSWASCQDIDPAQDVDASSCAAEEFDRADAELNKVYKELLAELDSQADLPGMTEARSNLIDAQRAWISLRDSDCAAVFNYNQTGTIRVGAELNCRLRRTRERIDQLEHLFDGP